MISTRKLAFFLPSLQGGGAERVMVQLANHLSRAAAVDMVLVREVGPLHSLVVPSVRIVNLNAARTLFSLPRLVGYLRCERPQAIISTLAHANVIAALALKLSHTAIRWLAREANAVSEQQRYAAGLSQKITMNLIAWAYRQADVVVTVSKDMAADLRHQLHIPEQRIVTVYNPVDLQRLRALSQSEPSHPWLSYDRQVPVVVSVGRLEAQKDFPTLLRAFASVRSQMPLRLIILGEGSQREHLEALSQHLGVRSEVDLPGFVDNPYPYIRAADVFVLSSAFEGMPNALIEALALHAPIVSTDCLSGPREILDHGRLGRLVPVGDSTAMADAIAHTLRNRAGHEASSDDRLRWVEANFSLEKIAERYRQLLLPDDQPGTLR